MGKFIIFIIFFVLGILGGAYLKENSTTPVDFTLDTTGKVVSNAAEENINFILYPFKSLSNLNPVVLSSLLLLFFVFLIFIITKTFSTLFISGIGLTGGVLIFFAPIIGFGILAFGVIYSLILEEIL
ncbi:hypothetical protein HZA33_05250 [Candidatus Pacearchaeota archaeon]|nr:hypothetical protein [Candidatus Pacearchaeota archaeon]